MADERIERMYLASGEGKKSTTARYRKAGTKTAQYAPIAPHTPVAPAATTTWDGNLAGRVMPTWDITAASDFCCQNPYDSTIQSLYSRESPTCRVRRTSRTSA
ncbi:hypothetical protein CNECB9_1900006 [Cupriavidus necator]|uniref:Uncharacterized protein n=1 Tax=Cupriavidus necator TaxID=106590 RepID=A0A1K0J9I3_CUPNE|nr:hypothetical protein CNECB9_1900006 [Cupriavidus necator]